MVPLIFLRRSVETGTSVFALRLGEVFLNEPHGDPAAQEVGGSLDADGDPQVGLGDEFDDDGGEGIANAVGQRGDQFAGLDDKNASGNMQEDIDERDGYVYYETAHGFCSLHI